MTVNLSVAFELDWYTAWLGSGWVGKLTTFELAVCHQSTRHCVSRNLDIDYFDTLRELDIMSLFAIFEMWANSGM